MVDTIASGIKDFVANNKVSTVRKLWTLLVAAVVLVILNDIFGYTYYYLQERKLNYIVSVERARIEFENDKYISEHLTQMLKDGIERKSISDKVYDSFQDSSFQDILSSVVVERNWLLHTITSSLFFILIELIIVILIFTTMFSKKADKWHTFGGLVVLAIVNPGFIWLSTSLFALIPILRWSLINYLLQLSINICLMVWLYKYSKKK